MTEITPPLLGGEMDPNNWNFRRQGEDGPLPNPVGHTFPLISHREDGTWRIVGTGFYITDNGLFVTARHVIDEVCADGRQIAPLFIVHPQSEAGLFGPTGWLLRPIMQCWTDGVADIVLGAAATATNNVTGETLTHWTWGLSWTLPAIGTPVATYAFPGKDRIGEDGASFVFRADSYAGRLRDAADFRDSVMLPFPYMQVDFRMHGGTSGGPILADGKVIGVNCTEYAPMDQEAALAFGTQIRCLRDAFLDDVIPLDQETSRRMSFDELVRTGTISIEGYVGRDENIPLQGATIRMNMPATAPAPQVGFVIYA
jgi:hypothetical protein